MTKKKTPAQSPTIAEEKEEIAQTIKQIRRSSVILTVALIGILVLFGTLLWTANNAPEPEPTDFESLYEKTLAGDESEFNFLYNNFVFVYNDPFWYTKLGKQTNLGYEEFTIPFQHNPKQLEQVDYQNGTIHILNAKQLVYLTFNPEAPANHTVAGVQVGRVVGKQYDLLNLNAEVAFTHSPTDGRKQITCENATQDVAVILFQEAEQTGVRFEGDCIYIEGQTPGDVVKAGERLAYSLLGIMPDLSPVVGDPIVSARTGDYLVEVVQAQFAKTIGYRSGALLLEDTAEGIYFVPTIQITNLGDELLEFNAGIFGVNYTGQLITIDYQSQRFLPGKLDLVNEIEPLGMQQFRVAVDVPTAHRLMNLTVKFLGEPRETLVVEVPPTS